MADKRTLTIAEVAEQLRVVPRTIYRMIDRGDLHAVKVGRVWRIPAEAVDNYLARTDRPGEREGGEGH